MMREKVCKALERWNMLDGCGCVAVGFSGGADSVSLLHVLLSLSDEMGFSVRAVHVNHGIRGNAAMNDENYCRRLCEQLDVPLDVFSFDVPKLAAEQGTGLEECGRRCRYRAFDEIAERYGCRIATAHTLSDSTETVILNIARGCGISGLRGIPPVRGNIIRPLILCTRSDIELYCAENSLEFVTDETNFDDSFSRNRVRLDIVPQLQKLNPNIWSATSRLMECAADDDDFLLSCANDAERQIGVGDNEWDARRLYKLPTAVRRRVIIIICLRLFGIQPEFNHVRLIENILAEGFGAVTLSRNAIIQVSSGKLRRASAQTVNTSEWCAPAEDGCVLPDGRTAKVDTVLYEEFEKLAEKDKMLFKSSVGCDIISRNVLFRTRREGDCFSPAGRGVKKTLKKLFNESHISPFERRNLLIAELDGQIIWIERFGAAEGYRPADSAECVSVIKLS